MGRKASKPYPYTGEAPDHENACGRIVQAWGVRLGEKVKTTSWGERTITDIRLCDNGKWKFYIYESGDFNLGRSNIIA